MAVTFSYSRDHHPAAPVVTVSLQQRNKITLTALLDTGADNSIFPIDHLMAAGADYVGTKRLVSVTGHTRIVDLYLVEVQIGDQNILGIHAGAIDPGEEALIRRDVLNHLIVTLDGIAGTTEIS